MINKTACTCSPQKPSGFRMRHQGGGICLLSECNDDYRCESFGYELCAVSPCSNYTTALNVVPIETTPFRCHLTPDAGTRTNRIEFLEDIPSVERAKADATVSDNETNTDAIDANKQKVEISEDKEEVIDQMRKLDRLGDNVTEE